MYQCIDLTLVDIAFDQKGLLDLAKEVRYIEELDASEFWSLSLADIALKSCDCESLNWP